MLYLDHSCLLTQRIQFNYASNRLPSTRRLSCPSLCLQKYATKAYQVFRVPMAIAQDAMITLHPLMLRPPRAGRSRLAAPIYTSSSISPSDSAYRRPRCPPCHWSSPPSTVTSSYLAPGWLSTQTASYRTKPSSSTPSPSSGSTGSTRRTAVPYTTPLYP